MVFLGSHTNQRLIGSDRLQHRQMSANLFGPCVPGSSAGAAGFIRRRKNLPQVNPDAVRRDIDNLIDPSLRRKL